jgi:hypothetical protein
MKIILDLPDGLLDSLIKKNQNEYQRTLRDAMDFAKRAGAPLHPMDRRSIEEEIQVAIRGYCES